jgi:predicted DNA-binding protein YlxM (UPF0122 family)
MSISGSSSAGIRRPGAFEPVGQTGPGASRRRPPKLYRIGEITDHYGFSRQTIHNYTTMGLITEARRTSGGHRLYDESVFARLDLIEELKHNRKSMREIRAALAELDESA